MAKQAEIEKVLVRLARPGMTSKQLRKEIEKAFPKASRRDLRLAAFAAMIAIVDKNPDDAVQLQELVLGPVTSTPA